jgi:hypothetical protein
MKKVILIYIFIISIADEHKDWELRFCRAMCFKIPKIKEKYQYYLTRPKTRAYYQKLKKTIKTVEEFIFLFTENSHKAKERAEWITLVAAHFSQKIINENGLPRTYENFFDLILFVFSRYTQNHLEWSKLRLIDRDSFAQRLVTDYWSENTFKIKQTAYTQLRLEFYQRRTNRNLELS